MTRPGAAEAGLARGPAAPGARSEAVAAFLDGAGWGGAQIAPLAGDASARRYHRVARGWRRAVLMDAPPPGAPDIVPFLAVTEWLRGAGFSAPEILAADGVAGLVLMEDLGDALFARVADDPAVERAAYAGAVDLLAALQALPPPDGAWRPAAYDAAFLLREARLAVEWYLPAARGGAAEPEAAPALDAALGALLPLLECGRGVPVLRDYHAENLLWLPERRGLARVGLLDYQDMLVGHPAYDLVSLTADARRDVAPDLAEGLVARHVAATGAQADGFRAAARLLSAQRNLKILGIFARLCLRDGKPGYLRHMPRVWAHLRRDLGHPALAPLAAWAARLPAPEPAILARIGAASS